ncbi:MAG: TonB-dependent receptor [Calditrichaeota bacterium]|nr:TonB-dependent receptor [Calditrichota bacterium]
MYKTTALFLLFFLWSQTLFAQPPQRMRNMNFTGSVYGFVFDDESKVPIEYANIILYSVRDSGQVTGTITDKDGYFKLENIPPGRYYMDVDFIGYSKIRLHKIRITPRNREINLKQIFLEPATMTGETVEVEANRVPVTYQIDKKVIKVSEQTTALSGTAVDVLENVPSVNVDIDGNVSLRGSGNFQVLIDNKPTILDANEVLQQIPASTIEDIEIITNPSAKYDPDGVAGIINIILKKNKLKGVSGLLNSNIGTYGRYGGDFLLSYRNKRFTINVSANYNRRNFPGNQKIRRETVIGNNTFYTDSDGDSRWLMTPYGLRGSVDINLTHWDVLTFGGRIGTRSMERNYDLSYEEWSSLNPNRFQYLSEDIWKRSGDHYAFSMDYLHKWSQKNRQFSAQIIFDRRTGDEKSTNVLQDGNNTITNSQITTEDEPASSLRLKVDYTHPFNENTKLEAGYQSRMSKSEERNKLYDYNRDSGQYLFQPLYSHLSQNTRNIHSLYTTFSSKWTALGYQIGLRSEYTYRAIALDDSQKFTIDRWDFFPTIHLSYQFAAGRQIMASYTRRIRRARSWWLEPFITWSDAYNVSKGNPALLPEYVDSYEMGHQIFLGKSLLSLEIYYRVTNNKVERVRSVFPDKENVILHTYENIGKDYSLGSEFLLNRDIFKWWNINYMASLYRYRVKGRLDEQDFFRESFNWSLRLNNDFRFSPNTRIQFNLRYRSPTVTSQGKSEDFLSFDMAFKQQFFKRKLSFTIQARDLFNTMRHEFISRGADFYYYRFIDRRSPMLSLTVTWIFNNYKQERRKTNGGENDFGGEDLF